MKYFLLFFLSLSLHANEQEALKTIKGLGAQLQSELKEAMKKSPAHAVGVCNTEAMKITKEASKKGILVGRVSTKNRNPNNLPKEWMRAFIGKYHRGEIKKPYTVIKLSENRSGLIKPIKTVPLCLNCHGTKIDKATAAKIKGLYPKDKAIGYKVGEIRGFFWAEFAN